MSEREIALKIEELSKDIAKAITKGKDVEIIKTSTGISIKEISKKKLA